MKSFESQYTVKKIAHAVVSVSGNEFSSRQEMAHSMQVNLHFLGKSILVKPWLFDVVLDGRGFPEFFRITTSPAKIGACQLCHQFGEAFARKIVYGSAPLLPFAPLRPRPTTTTHLRQIHAHQALAPGHR